MADDDVPSASDCRPSSNPLWVDDVEAASVPYQGGAFWALALVGVLALPLQAIAYLGRLARGATRSGST